MSRRSSGIPQTPIHNDDALERSLRRQSSSRGHTSLSDVARRVQESPLRPPRQRRDADANTRATRVAPGDFEEWMKLVRLKKVKANNAFTIQLIDAFHSMVQGEVLSQHGQNVTFQEATHTLGGCLTVYKNRIARVKDDTSKLLIGVSENKAGSHAAADEEDSDSSEGEEDDGEREHAHKRKQKPKKLLGADSYLAPASKLEINTNELATSIDPLLRKMSADFDKRGAGALLQYSLKVDKHGRLLLDAEAQEVDERRPAVPTKSQQLQQGKPNNKLPQIEEVDEEELDDDGIEAAPDAKLSSSSSGGSPKTANESSLPQEDGAAAPESGEDQDEASELFLAHFNVKFFKSVNCSRREALPMVEGINSAVANPIEGTESLIRDMQAWASTNPGDDSTYSEHEAEEVIGDEADGLDDAEQRHDDIEGLGIDLRYDGDFKDLNFDDPLEDINDDAPVEDVSLSSIVSTRLPVHGNWMDVEYLKKLDTQATNWAGPSFWKVRRLHAKDAEQNKEGGPESGAGKQSKRRHQLANAATLIDFSQEEEVDLQSLFATGSRSTLLRNKQYDLQNKHLLPVDMHVTTKQLMNLHLRPETGIAPAFRKGNWAHVLNDTAEPSLIQDETTLRGLDDINPSAENDDNFFYGGWEDYGGPNSQRPATASAMFSQMTQTFYGTQNNQLNFARVAKRVDVRRLKDNVWTAIQHRAGQGHNSENEGELASEPHPEEKTLIQVIQETQPLYSEQQRSDLSPAMYFISLLHLSNEKGLSLENTESLNDIRIRYEPSASEISA